ncbi:DUF6629 family protein [Kaarinaea lacus]
MCVSAAASFSVGAVLLPIGAYCVLQANKRDKRFLAFAVYPIAFGIQQLFEGMLWLSLTNNSDDFSLPGAFGFMFFSHFFWLFWVPFSVWCVHPQGAKKHIALAFTIIGGLYGALMYFPAIFNDGWLHIEIIRGSIVYEAKLIYDGFMPRLLVRIIYAVIILLPLLAQSQRQVLYFGILILVSVIAATVLFGYAFISVWCFMAAIISAYMIFMMRRITTHTMESHLKSNF